MEKFPLFKRLGEVLRGWHPIWHRIRLDFQEQVT